MLSQFLNNVDFEAVKRMKHRLFVVGRFNDKSQGNFPELFLLKHPNKPISDAYEANFSPGGVGELSFRSFLDLLKPTVYEVIEDTTQKGKFTQVKMLPPGQLASAKKRALGQYVLNELNWFVVRGFASTEQEAFGEMKPNLPKELLTLDSPDRGREIYKLIRDNLAVFGSFQPKMYRLVEAFSDVFGEVGTWNDLPAFGAGNELPPGFPEALIDFLYAEDEERRFSLDNVDISATRWDALRTSEGKQTFCSVVSAFRDEVIGRTNRSYNKLDFGGRTINDIVRDRLDEELIKGFRLARKAFTGMRQILRGKVLISMILQWALQSLNEIPDVKQLGSKALEGPKDRAKGNAILHRWKENGLAKPITRASKEERRRFSRELRGNFDSVLTVVLAAPESLTKYGEHRDRLLKKVEAMKEFVEERAAFLKENLVPDEFARQVDELKEMLLSRELGGELVALRKQLLPDEIVEAPEAVLKLAVSLVRDEKKLNLLRGLTSKQFGEDYKRSFINAAKILLTDVLCPTLFQDPIFTRDKLRRFFRSEMQTVYLMAVFLDNKTKDETVRVAEARQKEFQSYVDPKTFLIRDSGKLQSRLLEDFVDILTRPELGNRLDNAGRLLSEVYTVLEKMPAALADSEGARVSGITTLVPDDVYRSALGTQATATLATDMPEADLLSVIEQIAQEEALKQIHVQISAAVPRSSAAEGKGPAPGNSAASAEEEGEGEQFEPGESVRKIAAITGEILGAMDKSTFTPKNDETLPATFLEEQSREVALEARNRIEALHDAAKSAKEASGAKPVAVGGEDRPIDVLQDMKDNMRAFQSALFLIYQRYNENKEDKKDFRNNVDRFTLVNLMLLFQNELGLGDVHSSLMHLLLDLVLYMDKDNPDPANFWKERSPTVYFDYDLVDENGMTSLRQVLEMQAKTNLQAMINLVSELMGIRHLIESVHHDREAEIIVVNATARQFLNWLDADNINVQGGARSRLNPVNLLRPETSEGAIPPGLVYLSDAAFDYDPNKKLAFLTELRNFSLSRPPAPNDPGNVSVVLPPLCVSTGRQSEEFSNRDWYDNGIAMRDAAAGAPCSIVVVGPSSFLNRNGDAYRTFIPAGYVFGAHFLARPYQGLRNQLVQHEGSGRFFSLGYGGVKMTQSLDRVLWGRFDAETCTFAVDYYLYVILVVLASTYRAGHAIPVALPWPSYYDCFYNTEPPITMQRTYHSSTDISDALYGAPDLYRVKDSNPEAALHYKMEQELSTGVPLRCVLFNPPGRNLWLKVTDVDWFNKARTAARLP